MSRSLLEVERISMAFGGLLALHHVSMRVQAGQIKAVIGPNGAGKSTLFNVISGLYRPTEGDIRFEGRSIVGLKPFRIARLGITRTFQTIRLFPGMSVLETVMVGLHRHTQAGFIASALRLPSARREEAAMRAQAMQILEQVGLADYAQHEAITLPFGLQRQVEIARALAATPKLLLLDEPASGLNHQERVALVDLLHAIRAQGTTILLVEHDMDLVMDIAEEILVLVYGTPIAEGPPAAIREHPQVIAAYLGEE
nr:ABC transporter ATP-binding protein [Ardenticatena sp.]